MLCEQILGNLKEEKYKDCEVEYVNIEWYDAFTKIHKKTTRDGSELGIRLGNEVLTQGMHPGDVLYQDGNKVYAVKIPPCEVIEISISDDHPKMLAKVCYEIGNHHASLFWGENDHTVITPFYEPTLKQLCSLHGVHAEVKTMTLDFTKSISSSINAHTH